MLKKPDFRSFQAVIFDMDGVIFDTEHLAMRLWIQAADELGLQRSIPPSSEPPPSAPMRFSPSAMVAPFRGRPLTAGSAICTMSTMSAKGSP